jgi:xylulokinase
LAAPLYFGFSLSDFVPEVLCRAVLEGHVLNLYEGSVRMPVTPREIRLTGGLSNSPSWCQTIADVFDAETVPVQGEGAALGAAIHAAWVWYRETGEQRTLANISEPFVIFDESRRSRPNPQHRSTYGTLKRLYRALTRRMRGLSGEDPFVLKQDLMGLGN